MIKIHITKEFRVSTVNFSTFHNIEFHTSIAYHPLISISSHCMFHKITGCIARLNHVEVKTSGPY